MGFLGGSNSKESAAMKEIQVQSQGGEDLLKKETATHSRSLPGESMDRGAWWVTVHGVSKSWM